MPIFAKLSSLWVIDGFILMHFFSLK